MKKTILAAAFCAVLGLTANAEILRVTLNDGTSATFNVEDVKEITFEEESLASSFAGEYTGINSVSVGDMFTYTADITYKITANEDGTINLHVPSYQLPGTVMGDLTLGEYTVSNIAFDDARSAFYRDYVDDGLTFHFTCVSNGETTMDSDYTFKPDSNVSIEKGDDGLKVVNSFKMGSMPFQIVATFTEAE